MGERGGGPGGERTNCFAVVQEVTALIAEELHQDSSHFGMVLFDVENSTLVWQESTMRVFRLSQAMVRLSCDWSGAGLLTTRRRAILS